MAVKTIYENFLPYFFPDDHETKKNPNYRPQFSEQHLPHLSSSIPNINNNNNLIKLEKSIPSISFSDSTLDSGPIAMCEEPRRVARSVVAGCLLEYFDKTKPLFIPIVSEIMFANLNRYHLISAFEKEALIKAGEAADSDDDPKEKMISAIENALLSIEKDTGGVTCEIAHNLDGKGKDRVYANSIRVEILTKELLPVSLRFQDLTLSPHDVSNSDEYQRKKIKNLKLLYESNDVKWVECTSVKTAELPTSVTPTRTRTRNRRLKVH